LSNFLIF
jgi:regulator of replication initiation timing